MDLKTNKVILIRDRFFIMLVIVICIPRRYGDGCGYCFTSG